MQGKFDMDLLSIPIEYISQESCNMTYRDQEDYGDPAKIIPTITFRKLMPKKLLKLLQQAETIVPLSYFVFRDSMDSVRTSRTLNTTRTYTEKRAYVHVSYVSGCYEGNLAPSSEREGFGTLFNKHELYMGDWLSGHRHGDGI